MISAHSLDSIAGKIDSSLGVSTVQRRELVVEHGLVVPGMPLPSPRTRTVNVRVEQWSKLVGILFCPPGRKMAREEVLPQLDDFYYRSGRFVDFFCPGYGAYWPAAEPGEDVQVVATVKGVKWQYSAQKFDACRREVEQHCDWNYSGEAELLLLTARKEPGKTAVLDFSTTIACNLEAMAKDEAFSSVGAFFQQIFRFGEQYQGSDPVWDLSDKMGIRVGKSALLEAILSFLPDVLQKKYKSARHYAVRDINKEQ